MGLTAELVSLPTEDIPLDGLWYSPPPREAVRETPNETVREAPNEAPNEAVREAVMLMHGNGGNFYSGPVRFLPRHLVPRGYACLAFNRRGHETLTTRTREPEGNAFQTAEQAMADNVTARGFVASRGFGSPVVIGHSNGGLYAARHVADYPGVRALVLLSAHCGGPEMLARASALGLLAADRHPELAARARELVAAGQPDALMLMPGWWYVTSAASYLDMERNVPRLTEAAARISCPVLYLRGELEDRELYPAEDFAARAAGPVDVRIIEGADHFYTGRQDTVGRMVADWLDAVLGDAG
ncbi:MAG: alpha/beta hydrolase [Nocardiopsaceae bacterium]|nr:alpha/beta hydrolase [Nocardiopsaceae bacterium]